MSHSARLTTLVIIDQADNTARMQAARDVENEEERRQRQVRVVAIYTLQGCLTSPEFTPCFENAGLQY